MTKDKKQKKMQRVNTYLPEELVQRLDRYMDKLAATDVLGRKITRVDVLRVLLADALDRAGTP